MATLIGEIVGFLLLIAVIWRYVLPMLRTMLNDRQELIARQVREAEEAEQALAEAKRKHDSAVAEAEQESSRIRDDARADATRIREDLKAQAEQEVERIKQRGEEQLGAQRESYVRSLRAETASLSMQLATRIVTEALSGEDAKRASVDGFLDDLDGLGAAGGSGAKQPAQAGGGVS